MRGGQTMRKYRNQETTVDGITFPSIREADRYKELKVLVRAGEIHDLQLQVKFKLIPAQREVSFETTATGKPKKGKLLEHEVSYIADFVYKNKYGLQVVEDTKGFKTKDYIIKRKLMLWIHGIRVKEV